MATEASGLFLVPVSQALAGFELTDPPTVEGIKAELRSALVGFLVTPDGQADVRVQGQQGDTDVLFQVSLAHTDYYARALDLDLAMGPQPQMAALLGVQDTVDVQVSWNLELTFGVNDTEFYIVTSAPDELTIDITAALANDFSGKGRVGVFTADMTADPGASSGFTGAYVVDLLDSDGDNRLPLSDISSMKAL